MTDDASLDDFLGTGDQKADPEAPDESEADEDESTTLDGTNADPAATTLDWTPGGDACETCEEVVERRWRDDGLLVCESCKDW